MKKLRIAEGIVFDAFESPLPGDLFPQRQLPLGQPVLLRSFFI